MKRRLFLVFILFYSLITGLQAQQTVSALYLINEASRKPVADLTVHSPDYSFAEISDENGYVSLKNLPSTETSLVISGIGFESKSILISSLVAKDGKYLISLNPKITTLNDVVVSASSKTGVFKTISDLDIHIRPIINSQEVLRLVPGLFIGQHAGGGKAEQIFLRGFDLDHGTDINITADGMAVNMVSHAHGQGYADLHFVIPELIEKVNFNKGPYYADKGNLTTAGFVEFTTKNYLNSNFVKIEGGQFNTFRGITAINLLPASLTGKNQSLYFAGESSYTKGYFENPQNFARYNGLLKYHGQSGKNSTITALVSAFTSRWNASGQIPDRAVESGEIGFFGAIDNNEGGKTSRYNASFEILHHLRNGATLRNQVYFTKYLFELYSNFTFFKFDSVNGDQIRQKEDRNLIGFQSAYKQDHRIGQRKARFNTGIQVRYDMISNIELSRTKERNITTTPLMLGDIHELNAGFFAEEKIFITQQFDFTAGIRADYFANKYSDKLLSSTLISQSVIVSPKFLLNYRLNKKIQLYWYAGQGFHSNDTRVAVQQNGREVVTPARGTDIGGIFKIGRKLVLQTSLWYLWLKQEFVYVGDEAVVEPGGITQRTGWDASVRYEILKNLYADIDMNLANPRGLHVPKSESYLPLAPRYTSVGGLTYRKEKGWNGSIRYRYMAHRPANEEYTVTAKGYFLTDAAINYTKQKWEMGLSVQNVFNEKWKETQFDTESRLQNEPAPVSEIHFTPGSPFFARLSFTLYF